MHFHPRRWRYGYAWLTLGFFAFSLLGHWTFAWFAYTSEQLAHNQPVDVSDYLIQTLRDTLENWQSEFLQLLWQVGGLALFLHLGSPQSKEGNDRVEEKIDAILRHTIRITAAGPLQSLTAGLSGSPMILRSIASSRLNRNPGCRAPCPRAGPQ